MRVHIRNKITVLTALLWLFSCSSHPMNHPGKLSPGERSYSYSFAVENIVPVYTVHYGLSETFDAGISIGLPVWGSGWSLQYLASSDTTERRILNRKVIGGWAYQHNPQYELTYLRERYRPERGRMLYYGVRGNFIREGLSGDRAWRIGVLGGLLLRRKMMMEFGYTHDFALDVLSRDPLTNWPNEHSRYTGMSFKISFGDFSTGLR